MSGATVGTVRSAMNLAAALAGSLDWMAHDGQAGGSTAWRAWGELPAHSRNCAIAAT
jgi:hypothetical protein